MRFVCFIQQYIYLEKFSFDSRRHPDYPFALSFYINGLIDSRISVCCEYKHKRNVPLGGKHGLFGITDVQRVKPCERFVSFIHWFMKILSFKVVELNDVRKNQNQLFHLHLNHRDIKNRLYLVYPQEIKRILQLLDEHQVHLVLH
jgi:hypothetical protein